MCIGNRANGSHHARSAYKRSRGPLSYRAVLLVRHRSPHRDDTLLLYCWKNPLIFGPALAGLFFAARSRTARHAPSPRTAPVAWNTPSIKGRNAGFRPTHRSRPNRSMTMPPIDLLMKEDRRAVARKRQPFRCGTFGSDPCATPINPKYSGAVFQSCRPGPGPLTFCRFRQFPPPIAAFC